VARQEAQQKEQRVVQQRGKAARAQRRGGSQEKFVGTLDSTAAGAVGGAAGGAAEGAEGRRAQAQG